jgi:ferric iron reductase protein FhuF
MAGMTSTSISGEITSIAALWVRWPRPGDGEQAIEISALFAPDNLHKILEADAARYPEPACRRAAASVWSKHLAAAMLAAPALVALTGGQAIHISALVCSGVRPEALVLRPPASLAAAANPQVLGIFVAGIVTAAIDRLAAVTGLSPRVFWSNAANIIAYLTERWSKIPGAQCRAARLRAALLDGPLLPGTDRPNPLRGHIGYTACDVPGWETGARRRRICCLRDRLGQPLCFSCPKITIDARDAILAAQPRA